VYGFSPGFYQVIGGETGQPKIWPQSGSPTLGILQQIVAGCLVWFAAGLGNRERRAVLSLPQLRELAKSKIGFWGAAIFTDAAWTASHYPSQSWTALPPIFVWVDSKFSIVADG